MKINQIFLIFLLFGSGNSMGGESLLALLVAPAYIIYDHYKSPE